MAEEVLPKKPVVATCRTEGCAYNGVPSQLDMPYGEGNHTVVCAACSQQITDVVDA